MSKKLALTLGSILVASLLIVKEWLVSEEIAATRNQIKTQVAQQFENADTIEKISELGKSSIAFERFIEPVISVANKFLVPTFRNSAINEWTKDIHSEISDLTAKRTEFLHSKLTASLKNVRDSKTPGVDRLVSILKEAHDLGASANCVDTVQEEMNSIKEFASEKDATTLAALKEEGLQRLAELRKLLKKADQHKIGQLLSSGKFVREIQQPAIALILKIKQEELRTAAWTEFSNSISKVLTKKNLLMARAVQTKRQKEIEKLFNDPVIQAYADDPKPRAGAPVVTNPEPTTVDEVDEESLYENTQ